MIAALRAAGRSCDQLRPLQVQFDPYGYATISVLFELGNTKVLCAVDLQQGVPSFLRGKKTGWLKAEYAMLPMSTATRTPREASSCNKNGRLVEISRLIGRSLRSGLNLDVLGERTISVDCDVLQADGGTRTACITAANLALYHAAHRWQASGIISGNLIKERIAAVSVGIAGDRILLDLDYAEDMAVDADFNFVLTQAGNIVEIQGTAENKCITWQHFNALCTLAVKGVQDFFDAVPQLEGAILPAVARMSPAEYTQPASMFSLGNRIALKRNSDGSFNFS